MKHLNLILSFLIVTISFYGCKEGKREVETKKQVTAGNEEKKELNISPAEYEIIEIEDQSRKAFGKKSLSQYTTTEIEKLPTNKKILYKVVLSENIKENNIKPTVEQIVDKLNSDDPEIDEIILWLYSNKDALNNPYDIGSAIWAPNGELGNINSNIAKNNIRENYKIKYNIKRNLDEYLEQKSKSEVKFGFTEEERKQIFKDLVSAEDKANEYERNEQDKVLDRILEKNGSLDDNSREELKKEYQKISEKAKKIMTEEKSKVLNKYKITEEQEKEISLEGVNENWPFD